LNHNTLQLGHPLDLRLVEVAAGLPRPLRPESHGEAGRGGGQGAGVPTMLYMLLTAPELPKHLAKIREVRSIFVVGGAALPKELAGKAHQNSSTRAVAP